MDDSVHRSADEQEALRTAEVLLKNSEDLDANISDDDLQTWQLGQAIRQSAAAVTPEPDESLRNAVLARLNGDDEAVQVSSASHIWGWWIGGALVTAASLFVVASVYVNRGHRNAAILQRDFQIQGGFPGTVNWTDEPQEDKFVEQSVAAAQTPNAPNTYTVQVPVHSTQDKSHQVTVPVHSTQDQSYQVTIPYTVNVPQGYAAPHYPIQYPYYATPQGAGGWRYRPHAEQQVNAWAVQVNREWFEQLPVPNLPGHDATNSEWYASYTESSFIEPQGQAALSTFSVDVDTASYSNTRRFLREKRLPPPSAVRVEEFLNYFRYDYPQPEGKDPFSVNMEVAKCPWNDQHKLLRVGLKGKEIEREKRPASNIVFLLDVSGSMRSADKLPLMQRGLKMMVRQLREDDFVSIVTYAGNAGVVLNPTCGDDQNKIVDVIDSLKPGGSTNGSAGIDRAYELAAQNFVKGGTNRVILATDGDLNVGITDDAELTKLIKAKAGDGLFLTVLGFGTGNLKDGKMEKLADNGNGVYAYIDSAREAQKVLVQQMAGSLVTIAKDVKLQLEFNPGRVQSYRLLGYENRILAAKDFDDDAKDAGEIGAGHTVTAFYELVPAKRAEEAQPTGKPIKLKYQKTSSVEKTTTLTDAAEQGELLTLQLRYKQPDGEKSKLLEIACEDSESSFADASDDFRFASSVAAFGLLLRQSKYSGSANLQKCQEIASEAIGDDPGGYRSEFVDMVGIAQELWKKP